MEARRDALRVERDSLRARLRAAQAARAIPQGPNDQLAMETAQSLASAATDILEAAGGTEVGGAAGGVEGREVVDDTEGRPEGSGADEDTVG